VREVSHNRKRDKGGGDCIIDKMGHYRISTKNVIDSLHLFLLNLEGGLAA
jgi:hypothetical protein